jgi:hypothetical protein
MPTQAIIKRHIASLQMKRIQKHNRNQTAAQNSAKWSVVNKNPLGISSNRIVLFNDSAENLLNTSSESISKINQLSKEDVKLMIEQYIPPAKE